MSQTKEQFFAKCTKEEKKELSELQRVLGPLKYEGEEAPEGVIITDVEPRKPYRCFWKD